MNAENLNGEGALSGDSGAGKKGDGSIFSQNLELDFQPAGPAHRKQKPVVREEDIEPAERRTYFQIEATKVVDILREELERFGDPGRDPALVDDLWRSWQTLWGSGEETEQVEFDALFGTIRQALRAAAGRGEPELAAPEKLALGRLLQGMERLAGGRTGADDLQWCREAGNRVSRMVAAWMSEEIIQEAGDGEPAADDMQDDISGSIDEWFSQVSRFIPQSPEDEIETVAGATAQPDVSTGEMEADGREEASPAAGLDEIADSETAARPGMMETADEILASAERDAWEISKPEGETSQSAAAAGESGDLSDRKSGSKVEDIAIEGTSEGWLAEIFFTECCLDLAETIRNNIDRLEGSTASRTARALHAQVAYLLQLASDFGISDLDGILGSLSAGLETIPAAGRNDQSGDARRVEELLGALSTLERECEVSAVPAW